MKGGGGRGNSRTTTKRIFFIFFTFFFALPFPPLFWAIWERSVFFFYWREGGVVCRVSGTGVWGWRFESREMLFDRQLQRIVTEGTFRHGRNCARSRITRKITAPRPWPDSVAKANTRFCYSINCEPPAHIYKQGCPIFYWPFSSLNTQWAKTSRCVSNEEKPRCDSTGIARGIIKRRNERVRRRGKQSSCFDRWCIRYKFFPP